MASPMGQSIYETLKFDNPILEIRLAEIEPCADTSAPVRCTLRKVKLSEGHQYSALSYLWGKPTHERTIYLNDIKTGVTQNLELALRRVRDGTSERVLWIDAICINQADLTDRSSQVSIMGQTFGLATKVLCWVGPAEDGLDTTLAALDTSEIEGRSLTVEQGRAINERFIDHSLNERNCAALQHVISSPYWSRTWIVQEITLAREIVVLYGSVELPWQLFVNLAMLSATISLGPVTDRPPVTQRKVDAIVDFGIGIDTATKMRMRQQSSSLENKDILAIIAGNRFTDATDIRDKIYGFYGLAYDSARFVTVDYSKSATETYETFARRYIEQTQSLNVILHAWLRRAEERQVLDLPSWVPDWSWRESKAVRLKAPLYSAAKGTKYNFESHYISNVLRARGVLCDTITMFKRELSWFGLEDLLFSRGPNDYPTGIPRLQAMFRTLTVDNYFASDNRLNDDPNLWLLRLMMGFLTDLGMQAKPTAQYAQIAAEGVPSHDPGTPSPASQDDENQNPALLAHNFILAYRDWAESCLKVLDDMISRQHVPVPLEDGSMSTKMLWKRIEDLEWLGNHPAEEASSNINHLLTWKESLQKTRNCSSMEDMLELFLGAPGASNTIPWPGLNKKGLEAYYWPRFHLTRGTVMGTTCCFITQGGYFAVGPENIRSGDIVSVLLGCDAPVVLRSVGDRYALVGQCYVEGLMDGQAIKWVEEGKAAEQELEIV